jgi:hypothetical protein
MIAIPYVENSSILAASIDGTLLDNKPTLTEARVNQAISNATPLNLSSTLFTNK